jgi:hypothetical protein
MDIKQTPGAAAVLTLGKDMTFRDYAQGAYRMRGIGKGQTIKLFIIPEVENRMKQELGSIKAQGAGAGVYTGKAEIDVPAWLLVNSMRVESLHFVQMSLQELQNVWRKRALHELLDEDNTTTDGAVDAMQVDGKMGDALVASSKSTTSADYSAEMRLLRYGALASVCSTSDDAPDDTMGEDVAGADAEQHLQWRWLRRCVHLFREPISHEVPDGVPVARPFQEKVLEIVQANQDLLAHPQTRAGGGDGAARVELVVAKLAIGQATQEEEEDSGGPSLVSEVVHENEQEEEAEEEAEEEEQKMSAFSRDDEQHNPWQAALLRGSKEPTGSSSKEQPLAAASEEPFYGFEQFQARPVQPKLAFPSRLMLTDNFFRCGRRRLLLLLSP